MSDFRNESGLPKSTLTNFIKDVLNAHKVKWDKNVYTAVDKIAISYLNYVANLGCQICAKKGKKMLNIEHILDALKEMNFNKHIKLLMSEPYLIEMESSEIQTDDLMNVKQIINKKKKKSNKRKRGFDSDENSEEVAREQKKLFESARLEQINNMLPVMIKNEAEQKGNEAEVKEDIKITEEIVKNPSSNANNPESKEIGIDEEKDMFKHPGGEDEENFD